MFRIPFRPLLLICLLLLLAGLALGGYCFAPLAPPQQLRIRVASGASLSQVAQQLQQRGVIRSALALKLLARLRQQSGRIHSGSYLFAKPATPGAVLERLVAGDVEQTRLTIPEGFNLQQIAERIEQAGLGDRKRILMLASDPQLVASLAIPGSSLEGYLFPETYRFNPEIDEEQLLRMMVDQFRRRLSPELLQTAGKRKLDLHQLVTLASIIEKETGLVEEMPLISSVFHNRLTRHMPLQTDPTVIYGIAAFDGNLTRRHLTSPGPYNTYLNRGLPPGPIASPGLSALLAAAKPAESSYLYFVARGDGSHAFSANLRQHNRAVRKYQLKRRD